MGLGHGVLLRLINTLPESSSVIFDCYFTTLLLMSKLIEFQVHGTGMVQLNCLQKFQFVAVSKMKRGDVEEVVSD